MAFIEKNISTAPRETVVVASRDLAQLSASRRAQHAAGHRQANLYRHFVKRGIDILLVLLTAPFWVPLVLAGAALAMLDGHAPFYTQERVGLHGRTFRIWKLRSMVPDADACLESYLSTDPEARAEWDATQKLKNDPRITAVGRFLRKTSLDELPQLFNVLIGDMSLVGPRPIMVSQKSIYPGRRYYEMRPGLTGMWQISDRNECSFVERVHFDDAYHRVMSFWTDAKIILRTVSVVMRGTGY
jgi:lipopolysaccharide/colanic/teichoic acid biosynthesis glycosyltransferase